MNILDLLIKEKKLVGIEINDLVIRVAYSRPRKKIKHVTIDEKLTLPEDEIVLIEEPIQKNIIQDGLVVDHALLGKILKSIWKKEKLNKFYAIVSIPENKIYSRIFPFPKTVNSEHLKQAVELAIDFQLPFKKNDMYIGWENADMGTINNEVLISAIPKYITDSFVKAFDYADINVLVLESHIASITRSIKLNPEETTLITKRNQNSISIFSLKNNLFKFSRIIPLIFIKDDESLINEVAKTKESLESELKENIYNLYFEKASLKDSYSNYPEINSANESKWLVCIGALMRGENTKGDDNQISLLPVGTAEAYKYQKAKTFVSLMRNMIIGVSIFFFSAFILSYLFIFSLSQTINNRSVSIPPQKISSDITEKESLVKRINELTITSKAILSNTPNWSILIDEIKYRTIDGIVISSFSAPSIGEVMSITGIARSRYLLNQFKETLQKSPYLTDVVLPINNLEQKGDIPYAITFRLKDPSMLYYK